MITYDSEAHYLGTFDTKEEAALAYDRQARQCEKDKRLNYESIAAAEEAAAQAQAGAPNAEHRLHRLLADHLLQQEEHRLALLALRLEGEQQHQQQGQLQQQLQQQHQHQQQQLEHRQAKKRNELLPPGAAGAAGGEKRPRIV
jgi:hypothetical protein